jgi:uncharacterized protein
VAEPAPASRFAPPVPDWTTVVARKHARSVFARLEDCTVTHNDARLPLTRREFLGTIGATAAASASVLSAPLRAGAAAAPTRYAAGDSANAAVPLTIEPFDYQGVRLRPGRWQAQYESARQFYMDLSDDDVLHGFRADAGLPAPGMPLGGWADHDSSVVFGQWLQAMARASRINSDTDMRDKASRWLSEWGKTWRPTARMGHYPFEKMVGGLVDMHQYAGHPDALTLCQKYTEAAVTKLNRDRVPASRSPWALHSGRPLEWYTVGENLYRAYRVSGDTSYKDFAALWQYHAYWDKFLASAAPSDASGVHAYSHVNSFSSAALAYRVTGEPQYLRAMEHFYDFLQDSQCFATGGYGPIERMMPADGALGEALTERLDSCEAPCCSWAGFKLAKYLMTYTGQARFGDWIERLLYNAIGAALPIVTGGKHFYYANYQLGAAMKTYSRNMFTCCSGTYFQNVAEYADLIYFHDTSALYVNLFLPSEVEWNNPAGRVRVVQMTEYPESETVTLKLSMERPTRCAIKMRVPAWAQGMRLAVNGTRADVTATPGTWAVIEREWAPNDVITLTIPLRFRRAPVDRQHPDRVAVMRGPVVYAQEIVHKAMSVIPATDDELDGVMKPADEAGVYLITNEEAVDSRDGFMPYFRFPEVTSYRMYFDPGLRRVLW